MLDNKIFSEISQKITDALPQGMQNIPSDIEKNIQVVLAASFEKFNLITREEFDVQTKVLEKTRQKLEELEKSFSEIQKKFN